MWLTASPRMPLGLGGGGGGGAPRNVFRTILLMTVMVVGVLAVGVRLGENAIHSGSGLAGGILVFGIGFVVADVDAAYRELEGKGVTFTLKPARQPWGGYMGMFADPDGNVFYLDQAPPQLD